MSDLRYGRKFCTKCRTLKPLSDFNSAESRFGVSSMCKDCAKEYTRTYKRKNRKKALTLIAGGTDPKCVYCGCNLYEALQINHKYGGGAQELKLIGRSGHSIISEIISGRRKTDDLEVVCAICNIWHKVVKLDGLLDDQTGSWTITWKNQ